MHIVPDHPIHVYCISMIHTLCYYYYYYAQMIISQLAIGTELHNVAKYRIAQKFDKEILDE